MRKSSDWKTINHEFLEAVRRIEDGKPRNKRLRERAAQGKLKLSFTTVAVEAKRARGLISQEGTRYPDVRMAILGRCGLRERAKTTDARSVIHDLRGRVRDLEGLLEKAQSEVLIHLKSREQALREADKWRRAYKRVAGPGRPSGQGKVVDLLPKE